MECVKCVLIGDGFVGKTCLGLCFTNDEFCKVYVPTIFDNSSAIVMIDGKPVNLGLWDTAGQNEYDKIRTNSYRRICYMFCDKLSCIISEREIKIRNFCPNIPILLVGTKLDLRETKSLIDCQMETQLPIITRVEGLILANIIGAVKYVECTALTRKGLSDTFEDAVRTALVHRKTINWRNRFACNLF